MCLKSALLQLLVVCAAVTCENIRPVPLSGRYRRGSAASPLQSSQHRILLQLSSVATDPSQFNITALVNSSTLAGQQLSNSTQLLPLAAAAQAIALESTLTVISYGGSVEQGDPRLTNLALNLSQITTPSLRSDLNFTGQSVALSIIIQTNGWLADCTTTSQQLYLAAMLNITSLPIASVQLKSCTTFANGGTGFSTVSASGRRLVSGWDPC